MKKFCLIGDSQIAVLQTATAGSRIRQTHDLTFFACHVSYIPNLVLSGAKLVSVSDELTGKLKQFSGGRDCIDVEAYDEFIIIGHGFSMLGTMSHYRAYVSDSMPGPVNGKYLLSDACFLAAAEETAGRTEALRLAGLIRSVSDKPVTVVAGPNPGLGLPEEKMPKWYPPCHSAVKNGDDQALASLFRQVCARLAKKGNLKVVPPISEAAANGVFNLREYCCLPEHVDYNSDIDYMNLMVHGNDLYGRALLDYVFTDMDAAR